MGFFYYRIKILINSWPQFYFVLSFQPGRDFSGAAIALFTANLHSPLSVNHKTTLQGVVYQLDVALQSSDTQKSGLVFIYDMSGSKYSNFDYDLSQKILTLLKVSACKDYIHGLLDTLSWMRLLGGMYGCYSASCSLIP